MTRIRIDVAADSMHAHITVDVGEAMPPSSLNAALVAANVHLGTTPEVLRTVSDSLNDPEFRVERLEIARGQRAEHGFSSYFTPSFEPGLRPGQIREDGTMDFFDRELLKTVRAGERVGKLTPATTGKAGFRVDGTILAATPGAPSALTLGAGVTCDDAGEVSARTDGAIVYVTQRSLDVLNHVVHGGDVDLRTGHLDMQGSLLIKGNVTRGFRVFATGDLELRGHSEGGELCAGGNIRVQGALHGGDTGSVEAAGDVSARAAESIAIRAGACITLQDAVHAELHATDIAIARRIRGGRAEAEHSIVVADSGSAQGTATALEAGIPRRTADALKQRLASAKSERFSNRRGLSERGERGKGGKIGREKAENNRDALAHKLEYARCRGVLMEHAFIEVHGTLHAGTLVAIGDLHTEVSHTQRSVRFSFDTTNCCLRSERIAP